MAKKDKLTKSRSFYSLKKRHSKTYDGIIYENDHITMVSNDGLYDDDMVLYSDSNFKYRVDTKSNSKKRHVRGEFVKNGNDSDVWTLEDISASTISEESQIINKPNYSSLKDFAYYGSAVELITATVNDVIMRFPGGLSYYGPGAPFVKIGDTTYYFISNEFQIDCWTGGGTIPEDNIKNPMRLLAASYMNYEVCGQNKDCVCPVFKSNGSTCLNSIIGTTDFGAGDFLVFMDSEGNRHLVSTTHGQKGAPIIKPKQKFIDEFWNTMDDFERVLLNRDTYPVYKAVFETPYSNEEGHFYTNQQYIWPTVGDDDFTPDVTTIAFQGYLRSLMSLATYHDSIDSDNIWRMMTHESIKNLDWTYTNNGGLEFEEDFIPDTTGIGAMIRIYGRQFDDIKRYADNIKSSNSLSYDGKNNVPDYFISDKVEENGWIAKHVSSFDNTTTNELKSGNAVLYPKNKVGSYVNTAFQKRLALSSNYIQSLKGTRRGIETILGMFGYTQDDSGTVPGTFKIDEYIFLIDTCISYSEASYFRGLVENITESEDIEHYMQGFPVAKIPVYDADGNVSDEYLIPWFNKNEEYIYPFYFQCSGGWGKRHSKEISLPSLTDVKKLTSNGNFFIYGETQPYMRFANTINDMLSFNLNELFENMICYVTDISDINDMYSKYSDEDDDFSHYFSLKNLTLATRCGFVENEIFSCYGWKNIHNYEITHGNSDDAKRVLYLETLITNYNGNNPHTGNGKYDDGESYIENFTNIFKGYYQDGKFNRIEMDQSSLSDEEKEIFKQIQNGQYGFGFLDKGGMKIDNKKCAYFHDYAYNGDLWLGDGEGGTTEPDGEEIPSGKKRTKTIEETDTTETTTGNNTSETWNSTPYIGIEFPDTPTGVTSVADETQANAIINIKKIIITFGTGENAHLRNYIQDVVMKYLEEMIPSTAILEYRFDNETGDSAVNPGNGVGGTYVSMKASHVAIEKDNDNVTVWRNYPY